jgi:hypothetical protein
LVQRFQNENFAILGINTDGDADTFRAKCGEYEISWDNIFNGSTSGGVPQAWGVSGYPTTFLLDAEGRIRFKGLRHDAVAPEVEALLAEQSNSE